jgi:hypothetical protein
MASAVASKRSHPPGLTGWSLSLCIILSYVATLFLGSQRFIPWLDEVQFTDPGANLYFNGRFVSTVWSHQTNNEIFLGNAPLYPFLLGLWFKLIGFGVLQARALGWLFGVVGIAVALWIVDRSKLVERRHYPWLTALFLSSWGVNQSFWSARYDTLGLFLISLVVLGAVRPHDRLARTLSRLALFIVPFAGYYLVVVCIFILAFPVLCLRKPVRSAISEGLYLALGVAALFGTYAVVADVRKLFVESVLSAGTLPGQLARGVMVGPSVFGEKARNMLALVYQDLSFTFLLGTVLLVWLVWPRARRRIDRTDYVLLSGAILLPIALSVIGKYPPYYSWIGHSCACVLAIRVVEGMEVLTNRRTTTLVLMSLLGISAAVGVVQLGVSRIARSASPDQIASINAAVREAVRPGEYVYADMAAYFPARSRARYVYTGTYAQSKLLPGFPTDRPITTMIVQSRERSSVAALLGGEWRCGWRAPVPLAAGQDRLHICRRVGASGSTEISGERRPGRLASSIGRPHRRMSALASWTKARKRSR